jgi:AcrR family transcriptional regulator
MRPVSTSPPFQRARTPEQVAQRRAAILSAARELAGEVGVAGLTLRDIGERVGLAKSNVLRYFDSREAVLLTVLDQEWGAWLDALEPALDDLPAVEEPGCARALAIAGRVAASLAQRPLLCELASAMAIVLERNVGLEFARGFKTSAARHNGRLTRLVAERSDLPESMAARFTEAVIVTTAGLWPYTHPSDVTAQVNAEWGHPQPADRFGEQLADLLGDQLVGIVVRSTATSDVAGAHR